MNASAEATASRWHDAVVERTVHRTPRIVSLFFANGIGSFDAGQHVDVRLVAEDGYEARRSYSIASAPSDPSIELMVDRLDDGEVSPFLHDVLRAGDTIALRGPIGGHFVWTRVRGGPLLLIAGGSGIAPLMSMLRYRAVAAPDVQTLLLYGARTWDDIVYRDELAGMADADARLAVTFATSREAARRPADFGTRVDRALLHDVLARWGAMPRCVYVCGSTGFVENVTGALVAEGIAPSLIRAERYGGAG